MLETIIVLVVIYVVGNFLIKLSKTTPSKTKNKKKTQPKKARIESYKTKKYDIKQNQTLLDLKVHDTTDPEEKREIEDPEELEDILYFETNIDSILDTITDELLKHYNIEPSNAYVLKTLLIDYYIDNIEEELPRDKIVLQETEEEIKNIPFVKSYKKDNSFLFSYYQDKTKADLFKLAKLNNIDIKSKATKDQILQTLQENNIIDPVYVVTLDTQKLDQTIVKVLDAIKQELTKATKTWNPYAQKALFRELQTYCNIPEYENFLLKEE